MKRIGIVLALAVFGVTLGPSRSTSAAEVSCWYNGGFHTCVWYPGYSYEYPYGYGLGTGLVALATAPVALPTDVTAPLITGRSVAVSTVAGSGNYCGTPERTCRLVEPGWLGTGCSCRVPGGRARGFVE